MGVAEKIREIAPSPGTCAFNKVLLSKHTILQTKELLNIPIIKYFCAPLFQTQQNSIRTLYRIEKQLHPAANRYDQTFE